MINKEIPTLYMTVGLVASGKTTFAYDLANNINVDEDGRKTHVFDSDALREEMFGDATHQGDNGKLFAELHRRVKQCLKNGDNAVYCATNINSKRRIAFLNELTNIPCNKVCYIMATPYDQCLVNNESRERQVTEEIIERMYKSWNTPAMFEGWDDIRIHYWNDMKRNVNAVYIINYLRSYNQDNPHHTRTLGHHMIRAYEFISRNPRNASDLCYAASLHDIGKVFCRVFDDDGIAHYHNHENVGAYDVLFFDFCNDQSDEMTLNVSVLINLHMKMYGFNKSKRPYKLYNKYRKLWGAELYDKLVKLHEADVNAH